MIADYNRRVLSGLEEHLDDGVVPGEIPTHRVTVGRYRGAPREDCRYEHREAGLQELRRLQVEAAERQPPAGAVQLDSDVEREREQKDG